MGMPNISFKITRDNISECSRLTKNVSEKRFVLSKPGSTLYVKPSEIYLDGENGDLLIKTPIEKHISKEIVSNPDFFPKEVELENVSSMKEISDAQELQMYGKKIEDMDIFEKFEKFPNLLKEVMSTAVPFRG